LVGYYLGYEEITLARFHKVFEFVETLIAPGRFLDIGAGIGFSLNVAKERKWTAVGLEPNSALASHAKGRELDVINDYLGKQIVGEYDFILIDNVLEHILEPADFLRHAARLLAPTGVMLVAVPPMDWLRKGISANKYVRKHLDIPQLNIFREVDEHVNIFSRKAMGFLLKSAGLRLLNVRFHHSRAYNNSFFRGLRLDDGYYFVNRLD
jgi:SAM-dependent methyltransferase